MYIMVTLVKQQENEMSLTPSQQTVLEAIKEWQKTAPLDQGANHQTLGLSGRTSNSFDALVKKGLLYRPNPRICTYRAQQAPTENR